MKKKLFALSLAAVMILSFGGCAKKEATPEELYSEFTEAYQAVSDAKSIEFEQGITLKESGGLDLEQTSIVKKNDIDESTLEMSIDTAGTIKGLTEMPATVSAKGYYKDGYYYSDSNGSKLKVQYTKEQVLAMTETNLFAFPQEAVAEVVKADNTTTFTLDVERAGEFLSQNLGFLQELGLSELVDYDAPTVTIDYGSDGKLSAYKLAVPMKYTDVQEGAEPETIDYTISMTVKQMDGVTIEFPTDLDSYIDETAAMEALQSQGVITE